MSLNRREVLQAGLVGVSALTSYASGMVNAAGDRPMITLSCRPSAPVIQRFFISDDAGNRIPVEFPYTEPVYECSVVLPKGYRLSADEMRQIIDMSQGCVLTVKES